MAETINANAPLEPFGLSGNDGIAGGNNNDIIEGNDGDDGLIGFSGNDRLYGGSGDDRLSGGSDDDIMFGGVGNDRFSFDAMWSDEADDPGPVCDGRQTVADFMRGQDTLSLRYSEPPADGIFDPRSVIAGREVFTYLNTNRNGRLDEADAKVAIRAVTLDNQIKSSLVITFDADAQLTLFGVTTLTASDVVT